MKKYRTKETHYPVVVHTETGQRGQVPVVYEYKDVLEQWWAGQTFPLTDPRCQIEEIPQESIKVGDTFGKYVVVFISPSGHYFKYLCVFLKDSGLNFDTDWCSEKELREESA